MGRNQFLGVYKAMKNYKELSFVSDYEKMTDFCILSKKEFLQSYDYLTVEEYNATVIDCLKRIRTKRVHATLKSKMGGIKNNG